jgi:hypothetical protein
MSDLYDDLDDLDSFGSDDSDKLIAQFDAEVTEKMKVLRSRKADIQRRVDAAYWLGESGAPKAIMALQQVYRQEKNRQIRSAAEYSLGMFKALDLAIARRPGETVQEALERDANIPVRELLEDITIKGRRGRRKRIPTSLLVRLQLLLVFTLIVLAALNFLSLNEDTEGGGRARTGIPARDALIDLRDQIDLIQADAQALLTQFDLAASDQPLDCAVVLNRPEPYTIAPDVDATHPNIGVLSRRVDEQRVFLAGAQDTFDAACESGTTPDTATIEQAVNDLTGVINILPGMVAQIDLTDEALAAITPTPEPTDELAEVVTEEVTTEEAGPPTETPEPTLDPLLVNDAVRDMIRLLNGVEDSRGALGRLTQYWEDVAATGATGGCLQVPSVIPDPYELDPAVAEAYPELQTAIVQINDIGLTLLGQGWDRFITACAAEMLTEELPTGQAIVQNVADAFTSARAILNSVSAR